MGVPRYSNVEVITWNGICENNPRTDLRCLAEVNYGIKTCDMAISNKFCPSGDYRWLRTVLYRYQPLNKERGYRTPSWKSIRYRNSATPTFFARAEEGKILPLYWRGADVPIHDGSSTGSRNRLSCIRSRAIITYSDKLSPSRTVNARTFLFIKRERWHSGEEFNLIHWSTWTRCDAPRNLWAA